MPKIELQDLPDKDQIVFFLVADRPSPVLLLKEDLLVALLQQPHPAAELRMTMHCSSSLS